MDPYLIYITCAHAEEAKDLARGLLDAKLIACANILPGMTSLYCWDGSVVEEKEAVLLCKTHADKFDAVEDYIKQQHSYDVPCIVGWPLKGVHQPYCHWLESQISHMEKSIA